MISATLLLCLVCSVLVSVTAVSLKTRQDANKQLEMEKNILAVSDLVEDPENLTRDQVVSIAKKSLTPRLIELKTGQIYTGDDLNVATYDFKNALKDDQLSDVLPQNQDPASIKRKEHYAKVYLVHDEKGDLKTLILPVRGYGLWSTLYGFLALEHDLETIRGLTFYEQQETPGLGGEVDNPRWKKQWKGKHIFDQEGRLSIQVVKGTVQLDTAKAKHQVDGISGATLTSRGVNNLINFWLGPQAFGPFLFNLKQEKRKS
ncbi:MAG: Na(+)-translocating NADH-quinone reductase subunit C [Endozoicomonadaceae bacterium]|nr:Na(+)-translocating NADH-quinone reductase subunit C [Endozoicomonadaceae bacterium]